MAWALIIRRQGKYIIRMRVQRKNFITAIRQMFGGHSMTSSENYYLNKQMITIRASSLSELFDCPARWEAKHIRKLRLPRSAAAQLGTAIHAGTSLYDQSRLDGNPLTPDEAAGAVVDAVYRPEEDVDWGDDSPREAEAIGIALHKRYCEEIAPHMEYVAVEALCERLEITDLGIVLTGTTDRIFKNDDGFGIADIKTGKTAVAADGTVKTSGHAAQLGVYELLAGTAIGCSMDAPAQIIGLQVAKTPRGQRTGRAAVHNARDLLVGDDDAPGLLQIAAEMLHAGMFYGNARSQLCNPKFCPAHQSCRWRK